MIEDATGRDSPSRLTYLRLHADSMFLSALALASGSTTLARPHAEVLTATLGHPPISIFAWSVLLMLGGLLVGVGTTTRHFRSELVGRAMVVIALVWAATVHAAVLGPTSGDAIEGYIVVGIVTVVCALRASALLSPMTVYVVYPGRERPAGEDEELVLQGSADPAGDSPSPDEQEGSS